MCHEYSEVYNFAIIDLIDRSHRLLLCASRFPDFLLVAAFLLLQVPEQDILSYYYPD